MKYTKTRIVYEDCCWFCPQYRWWGIWFNYKINSPRYTTNPRATFLKLEHAIKFTKSCVKHKSYKGPEPYEQSTSN